DLTDNDLLVDYDPMSASPLGTWNGVSAYTGVTGLVAAGRNGGNWNAASGITTSSASGVLNSLAVAEASDALGPGTHLYGSETVDNTTVILKYTYGGDANLDGKIDISDYGRIDFNIPLGTNTWFNGDFNYDGKIDISDYGVIDFNIGIQGAPFSATGGVDAPPSVARFDGATTVPEPIFPLLVM